jgi:CO/xanthine dehydrogenase FAD-binding subunit
MPRTTSRCSPVGGTVAVYLQPENLAQALEALQQPGVSVLAGGTDFFPALGDRVFDGTVLDISAVPELHGIRHEDGETQIGATVTWTEIATAQLPRGFRALQQAARQVGSVQIQNRGTIAGNLCNASPAADGIPPLLVLDAEVMLESVAGTRRLPLAEFVLGYRKTDRAANEMVSTIVVPQKMSRGASAFRKLGARQYLVISISMVAAALLTDTAERIVEARIAVGSCAARSLRLTRLEAKLQGANATAALADTVTLDDLSELSPLTDVRGTSEYRRQASLSLVRDTLQDCVRGLA